MRLLMMIVNEEFEDELLDILNEKQYSATVVASTGQFLQYGNTTLILGIAENEVEPLIQLLKTKMQVNQVNEKSELSIRTSEELLNRRKITLFVVKIADYIRINEKEAVTAHA